MNTYTTDPLSLAVKIPAKPETMHLPAPGKRDPIFDLTRSFLNSLILPTRENNGRPPVRSFVMRKRNARTGHRLVLIDSLREYIYAHTEPAWQPTGTEVVI
jgi:hypothetical protein